MSITGSAPTVEAIMEINESSARHMANDAQCQRINHFAYVCRSENYGSAYRGPDEHREFKSNRNRKQNFKHRGRGRDVRRMAEYDD